MLARFPDLKVLCFNCPELSVTTAVDHARREIAKRMVTRRRAGNEIVGRSRQCEKQTSRFGYLRAA